MPTFNNQMRLVQHQTLEALQKQAVQDKQTLFETEVSWSYRIFNEVGNTIRMHIFYKPCQPRS